MKNASLIVLCLSALSLTGCIRVPSSGNDFYQPCLYRIPGKLSPMASYSIATINNAGDTLQNAKGKEMPMRNNIRETVRVGLKKSRLFSGVYGAELRKPAPCHLHFTFQYSSRSVKGTEELAALTFTGLPAVEIEELTASATLFLNGKQVEVYHTQKRGTVITWAPLILAAPFCNDKDALAERAMESLLEQLAERK